VREALDLDTVRTLSQVLRHPFELLLVAGRPRDAWAEADLRAYVLECRIRGEWRALPRDSGVAVCVLPVRRAAGKNYHYERQQLVIDDRSHS
jgi:hypothetical protein